MSVGPARALIPVFATLVFAAALGFYFTRNDVSPRRPGASGVVSQEQQPAAGASAGPAVAPSAVQGTAVPPGKPGGAEPGAGPAGPAPAASATPPAAPGAASKEADASEPKHPSFDVVRVEPTGESVIAGRAAPGATVELLRNGEPFARVIADASGLFAFVPPPLPQGSHDLVLQTNVPEGKGRIRSAQSVTVVIGTDKKQAPLVTIAAPDQPTVVLSQPEEPAPAPSQPAPTVAAARQPDGSAPPPAAPAKRPEVRIFAVEAEGAGRLFVSGQAAPGATVRLYLNDAFVAPGGAGPDGRLSFAIGRGVKPGDYRVRLDDVDPVTGAVKSRAEVPFSVPQPPPVAVAGAPIGRATDAAGTTSRSAASAPRSGDAPAQASDPAGPRESSASGTALALADPGQVVVPEVNTAIVARGDNLWRISKRVYGKGLRYTVIFGANTPQIRNPHLIYPGQVFVLPADEAQKR